MQPAHLSPPPREADAPSCQPALPACKERTPQVPRADSDSSGSKLFVGGVLLIVVLWGGVLPSLAQRPRLRAHLDWLDERGIDPNALYYTDLESMEPLLDQVNRTGRMWKPPQTQ